MKWIATTVLSAGFLGFGADAQAEHDSAPTTASVRTSDFAPAAPAFDRRVRCGTRPVIVNDCGQRVRYDRRCRPAPRRVWVAPVYREVHVGYDRCGNHIHRRVLVRAGYWRTVYDRYR